MELRRIVSHAIRAVRNEPAVRRAILRSKKLGTNPADWFLGIDDDTWFWMNTTGPRLRKPLAGLVAGMPEASLQEMFTGHSGTSTLREGFNAYRIVKKYYETNVGPIGSCRGVLDFGCGWGRIIRFFLRDVTPQNLTGVDHSEEVIRICQETNRWCNFRLIEPYPPMPFEANSFDLIYLYSVFSHLPEEMHWTLLREFRRLLTPGGMLIATTRARAFIQTCKAFVNMEATTAAYDHGDFCYVSHGVTGRWAFWGEACIPKGYVTRRWPEIFNVCDYIENDETDHLQNFIVARKPT